MTFIKKYQHAAGSLLAAHKLAQLASDQRLSAKERQEIDDIARLAMEDAALLSLLFERKYLQHTQNLRFLRLSEAPELAARDYPKIARAARKQQQMHAQHQKQGQTNEPLLQLGRRVLEALPCPKYLN